MTDGRLDTSRLQNMARAYTETAVLWAAIDVGLFSAIAEGAHDETAVAEAIGVSVLDAERLVVCCLTLDLIRHVDDRLVNAPDVQRYLVAGEPRYAGAWMTFTRRDVPEWFRIAELMKGDAEPTLLGMYDGLTVEAARKYHRATYSVGMGAGRRFVREVDLTGRTKMLDIGGGSGAYSINVVQVHSEMTAVVFDLPPVAEVAVEFFEQNGVADRVAAVGGDFTADPFPTDCDVAVMASNLPIYDASVIGSVIKKANDALLDGGEMHLIGEMLDDDRTGPADAAMWGMNELMYGGRGRAHAIGECIGYFDDAGFVDIAVTDFVPGVLKRVSGRKVQDLTTSTVVNS